MKPITNALLAIAIICYTFLPFYELSFEGSWTGLKYSSEVISNIDGFSGILFALLPYLACFGGIMFNCLKNRYWGIVSGICIVAGLYFYHSTYDFTCVENPQLFSITELGFGFNIGYGLLIAALASAILSTLPFPFNTPTIRKK